MAFGPVSPTGIDRSPVIALGAVTLKPGPPAAHGLNQVKSGTGFFVSANGLLVTAAHVAAGCEHIEVWRSNGDARAARTLVTDRSLDLALLATGLPVSRFGMITSYSRLTVGERVAILGFGVEPTQPLEPMLIRGTFAGEETRSGDTPVVVIRARVPRGASGGIVVDRDGSLVGMIIGYYTDRPDIAVAVPKSLIAKFLTSRRVPLLRWKKRALRRLSVLDELLRVSALVQCAPKPKWEERAP